MPFVQAVVLTFHASKAVYRVGTQTGIASNLADPSFNPMWLPRMQGCTMLQAVHFEASGKGLTGMVLEVAAL